jgi:hypothetical protein
VSEKQGHSNSKNRASENPGVVQFSNHRVSCPRFGAILRHDYFVIRMNRDEPQRQQDMTTEAFSIRTDPKKIRKLDKLAEQQDRSLYRFVSYQAQRDPYFERLPYLQKMARVVRVAGMFM